jgi:hypothetical protein
MIEAVREHFRNYPQDAERLLWADDIGVADALTIGATTWRIPRIHVKDCSELPLRQAMETCRGKDSLLKTLKSDVFRAPKGRRYGNARSWDYIRDPEDVLPIPHVHACPECYEYVPCEMPDCALEPDLELDDDTPSGAHHVCDNCLVSMQKTGAKAHFGRSKS